MMRKTTSIFFLLSFFLALSSFTYAEYLDLPKDSEGWTIFAPSTDSRIVYVSNDGDDATGQVYSESDFADPFNPSGEQAFATYAAAFEHSRDGYPDWILVRRGDTFYENIGRNIRSGRSATEPFLVASYGSSGLIPTFKSSSNGVQLEDDFFEWIAVSGLSFYAHSRDPDSPEYESCSGGKGLEVLSTGIIHGVLIEGCRFRYFDDNRIGGYNGGVSKDFIFRRNIILDNYDCDSHSQGLLGGGDGLLLEENIFDHNGWYKQSSGQNSQEGGQATMFNHNVYSSGGSNYTIRNNIFMRPSSMGTKLCKESGISENVVVDNNLYIDGEIGIGMASHTTDEIRYENYNITNNVITNIARSRPTNRSLGWHITLQVLDGGVIKNNYMLHQNIDDYGGILGISLTGLSRNILMDSNVMYDLRNAQALRIEEDFAYERNNITFSDSIIQIPYNSGIMLRIYRAPDKGWDIFGNTLFSDRAEGERYSLNGSYVPLEEISTGNNIFGEADFADPGRSIETYQASLGKEPTIDAFIQAARMQDRYNWSEEYTAPVVNAWIKEGFEVLSEPTSGCLRGYTRNITQYGITWNLSECTQYGRFVNGDYWVKGPVTITSMTPGHDGSHHGWMVNHSGKSQGYESRSAGYDASLVPSLPYVAHPGDAIIKSVSVEPLDESCRPCLQTTAVLTVLGDVPADTSSLFRPSFFGTERRFHSVDEINPEMLPSFPVPEGSSPPALDWVVERFKMMQLDVDSCCNSEGMRAADNFCLGSVSHACSYGGRVALANGDGALRLMLDDPYQEKEEALIHYLQFGLDLYYQLKQGVRWYPNGGHGSGRKLPIIFAGIILENDEIKDAVRAVEKEAGDASIFQEDGFLYTGYNDTALFGSGGNYWENAVTDYGSRTSIDPQGYIDGGHVPGTSYQRGINSMIWKGPAIAMVLLPEIQEIWDNPLFMEYVDRWVNHGTWSRPDPCAPPMGYCIGGANAGEVCTYSNDSICGDGYCGAGACPPGADEGEPCGSNHGECDGGRCDHRLGDFWQVTFGPDTENPGDCIRDTDTSDGIGRFPSEHGMRADSGTYQSSFVNSLWSAYRDLGSYHNADTNLNGVIELSELNSYVQEWKISSQITLAELIEVIELWKNI